MKKGGSRIFARRNMIAKDLYTPKYGPRIKETNRRHLIDELREKDSIEALDDAEEDYEFYRKLGMTTKE